MRRAAILGDGWMPYLYSARRYAESVATVRRAADDTGRDLSEFHWCVWVFLNINPDGNIARRASPRRRWVAPTTRTFKPMIDKVAAAGNAVEVTAKLLAFYDAGARHFVFLPATAGADPKPVLDRLFGEVTPALHGSARRSA